MFDTLRENEGGDAEKRQSVTESKLNSGLVAMGEKNLKQS